MMQVEKIDFSLTCSEMFVIFSKYEHGKFGIYGPWGVFSAKTCKVSV